MSRLGEKIMAVLGNGPMTEAAIGDKLADGENFWSQQAVAIAVRGLRTEGLIRRSSDGILEAVNVRPAASALAIAPPAAAAIAALRTPAPKSVPVSIQPAASKQEPTPMPVKTRKCAAGGHELPLDQFDGDRKCCRACLQKIKDKKTVKDGEVAQSPKAAPPAPAAAKPSNGAAPPARMVLALFSVRVEDVHGYVHDLSLGPEVIKRLAAELQPFI